MNSLKEDYTDKETGLTEKDTYFLTILFGECGGDFEAALSRSGLSESPSSVRRRLKHHIQEETKNFLAASSAKAAIQLVGVLTDPSLPGVKNTIAAAKEIMDRGGVVTEEETKRIENYVFILPAKEAKVIDHED